MLKSYSLTISLVTSITDHTDTVPYMSRAPIWDIPLASFEMNTSF